MQYMGSKNRISKHLIPIIMENYSNDQWYIEPFVGGANMIDKIPSSKKIGADSHLYLISLLKALKNGYIPPSDITKDLYYDIKANKQNYSNELVGFVGFLCSFGGKWWGGYASNSKGDNYAARGSRVLVKQSNNFKNINFLHCDYLYMDFPTNSLIYCDPPYEGTTNYGSKFNHDIFWEWCRIQKRNGHTIFISEYKSPSDFKCVKEIQHKTILDKNSNYQRTEKLFTL